MYDSITRIGRPLGEDASADYSTTFNELWDKYRLKIFTRLHSFTHNKQDAEDLLQKTYLRALRGLPHLKNEKNLYGWLYLIATRIAYDWHRHQTSHAPPVPLSQLLIEERNEFEEEGGERALPGAFTQTRKYDPDRYYADCDLMRKAIARCDPDDLALLIAYYIDRKDIEDMEPVYNARRNLNAIYKRLLRRTEREMEAAA